MKEISYIDGNKNVMTKEKEESSITTIRLFYW